MSWSIEFWPRQCDSISMQINNESWEPAGDGFAWKASEGHAIKPLPDKWRELEKIHVAAWAHPEKQAEIRVLWDGLNRQGMTFTKDENKDVEKP